MKLKSVRYYFIVFFLSITFCSAQVIRQAGAIRGKAYNSNSLEQIPFAERKTEGSFLLFEDWMQGDLQIKPDRIIENVPIRYDLRNDQVEIKFKNDIKVLNATSINQMILYAATSEMKKFKSIKNQLFEILVEDKISLLKQTTITLKRPDYVPGIDVGSRNDEVVKKINYFSLIDGQLQPINLNKKKFAAEMKQYEEGIGEFLKSNRTKLRDEYDLIKVFLYLNK
ncbi:MAG: hypothetical protein AAF731_08000 [Bacteroidota bacterium]